MDEKITIQEWIRQERQRIGEFLDNWLDCHKEDPERFPLEMPAGEWDEQYQIRAASEILDFSFTKGE